MNVEENWKTLADKTKHSPLFSDTPAYKEIPARLVLRENFVNRFIWPAFILIIGSSCFFASIINHAKLGGWIIVVFFAGILFLYFSFSRLLSVNKLRFDASTSMVSVNYGHIFKQKTFSVPTDSIEITVSMARSTAWHSQFQKGTITLSLHIKNNAKGLTTINLACLSRREKLDILLMSLSKYIKNIKDLTIASAPLPDGTIIQIPKTGISRNGQNFKAMDCIAKDDQLIFRRSFSLTTLWSIVFLFGISGIAFLFVTGAFQNLQAAVSFTLGFLLFAALGAFGLLFGFGTTKVKANKKAEDLLIRQGLFGTKFGSTKLKFSDISAVQICPKYVIGDPGDFTVYELNLVLNANPLAQRINVKSDINQKRLVSEAKQLSAFLKKPLLDHTA